MTLEETFVQLHELFFPLLRTQHKTTNLIEHLDRGNVIKAEARAHADSLERNDYPSECVQCWRTLQFRCEMEGGECNNLSGG
jgi:hypothetical protein